MEMDKNNTADSANDLGNYLYFGGQKIPIRHDFSPLNPELCRALGVNQDDMREACASMQVHICYTPLSSRALNALMRYGIQTVDDVKAKTDKELLALRNFGKGCLSEVHRLFPDRVRERKIIKTPRIRDKERFSEIVQMRLDGQTIRGIAKKYGISYQRVHQILQQAGIKTDYCLTTENAELNSLMTATPDEARNP